MWVGKLVRLSGIEPEMWQAHIEAEFDVDGARHSYQVPFPSSRFSDYRGVERESLKEPDGHNYRFQIEANHPREVVGSIVSRQADPRTGTFTYGLHLFPGHRRKGYASEAIILLCRYFFMELRYQKVTVSVYSFNEASIKLHEKLGFVQEGCLRRMVFTQGAFFDELMLGMLREEFEQHHADYLQDY
ncbi:MAG: GNAT family N-acetyltransferase [Chloroflexi bacterium]|nr:GNAT family N-acetyltransferase [Chloroflexota bacterium]